MFHEFQKEVTEDFHFTSPHFKGDTADFWPYSLHATSIGLMFKSQNKLGARRDGAPLSTRSAAYGLK